jgi:hypothetical protein
MQQNHLRVGQKHFGTEGRNTLVTLTPCYALATFGL